MRDCHHLPQADASIIGWDPLVPIRAEPLLAKSSDGPFGQVAVLETPSRQNHSGLTDFLRQGYNRFDQSVVKSG